MLHGHAQHQAKRPHTKCHDLHHDKLKTTIAVSKIPATEFSWTRPLPAKWRTGKNICPLSVVRQVNFASSISDWTQALMVMYMSGIIFLEKYFLLGMMYLESSKPKRDLKPTSLPQWNKAE